jgi:hypothetical protein
MKELYIKDLANHGGPESCVGVPRGRSEALTGVRVGWAIEPRNQQVRGADAVPWRGRQHRWRRCREASADPAGSRNLCMRVISPGARTGRSHDYPPVVMGWAGRAGKAEAVIP